MTDPNFKNHYKREAFTSRLIKNLWLLRSITEAAPYYFKWKKDSSVHDIIRNSVNEGVPMDAWYAVRSFIRDPVYNSHFYITNEIDATQYIDMTTAPFNVLLTLPKPLYLVLDDYSSRIETVQDLYYYAKQPIRTVQLKIDINSSNDYVVKLYEKYKEELEKAYSYLDEMDRIKPNSPMEIIKLLEKYASQKKTTIVKLKVRLGLPLSDDEMNDDLLAGLT